MDVLKPPQQLNLQAPNVAQAWRKWRTQFDIYFNACELGKKDKAVQCAIFLHSAGPEAVELSETFQWTATEDKTDLNQWLEKFERHCEPQKNVVFERYQFWSRNQHDGEHVDTWLTELRKISRRCEFAEEDAMLRDKLVFGVRNVNMKERLLREPKLTLARALELCRAAEASKEQVRAMTATGTSVNSSSETHVDAIRKQHGFGKRPTERIKSCRYCGRSHDRGKCPAYGKICRLCGGRNHFDNVCENRGNSNSGKSGKPSNNSRSDSKFKNFRKSKFVRQIDEHFGSDCDDDHDDFEQNYDVNVNGLFIGAIGSTNGDKWQDCLIVNGVKCHFKLDTGADANVLPKRVVEKTGLFHKIVPTSQPLRAFGGAKIMPLGTIQLSTVCPRTQITLLTHFYVTDTCDIPILGKNSCEQFKLVQRIFAVGTNSFPTVEHLISNYADVFTGLGKFQEPYKITVDPAVKPVIQPCRKVPFSKQEKLKNTLEMLERDGVIANVDRPTDWVHNLVITEKKNGSMRICLDPKPLNIAIKREIHRIPTADDVQAKLCGKTVFTVVDMKDSYWQVCLDDDSSYLCTFHTPWGRKRFLRMPFGISSAGEVMQKRNETTFGDINGVYVIADDLIIAGKDVQEHDQILHRVMQRAQEKGVRFNRNKLQFKLSEVTYMGNVVSSEGLRPCPKKIDAIVNMPEPTCKTSLQRLLGMIRYLSQFIPNESTITAPLRSLLKKDSHWHWNHEHKSAFQKIKQAIAKPTMLKFYDLNKPVIVQADSSQSGLGACISQDSHPIAYASRALSSAECNYSQIEKELLAISFACHKFHQYLYGRDVEVHTDHRPLESIFKKPLVKAAPRLQRMLLQLQKYRLHVCYVPGRLMYVSDTLSRAYIPGDPRDGAADDEEIMVHAVDSLPMTSQKRQEFKDATAKDQTLQRLNQVIFNGWPKSRKAVPIDIQNFWNIRDELYSAHGLLFFGQRLIVPTSLRSAMLALIHESHLGIEKCKSRAREVLYWPSMLRDIESTVNNCEICVSLRNNQQKEPMIPHKIPNRPWKKLAADIMTLKSRDYLVVTDYYSKYPELALLERKNASCVILHLKSIMARHGIPEEICSDNMPFNSAEFLKFAKDWGFKLTTSSPTYAQSNGMAEKTVQTVKRLLKKASLSGIDPYIALLEYRNTPVSGMSLSPAQMLMSRRLRGKLPTTAAMLKPKVVRAKHQLQRLQEREKQHYDKGSRHLRPLRPGDSVHVRAGKSWKPAVVIKKLRHPRSYIVSCDGVHIRRNRRHLMFTPGIPIPRSYAYLDDDFPTPLSPPRPNVTPPRPNVTPPEQNFGNVPLVPPVSPPPIPHASEHPVEERAEVQRQLRERKPPSYLKDYVTK